MPFDGGPGLHLVQLGPVLCIFGVPSAGQEGVVEEGGEEEQQRKGWRLPEIEEKRLLRMHSLTLKLSLFFHNNVVLASYNVFINAMH